MINASFWKKILLFIDQIIVHLINVQIFVLLIVVDIIFNNCKSIFLSILVLFYVFFIWLPLFNMNILLYIFLLLYKKHFSLWTAYVVQINQSEYVDLTCLNPYTHFPSIFLCFKHYENIIWCQWKSEECLIFLPFKIFVNSFFFFYYSSSLTLTNHLFAFNLFTVYVI